MSLKSGTESMVNFAGGACNSNFHLSGKGEAAATGAASSNAAGAEDLATGAAAAAGLRASPSTNANGATGAALPADFPRFATEASERASPPSARGPSASANIAPPSAERLRLRALAEDAKRTAKMSPSCNTSARRWPGNNEKPSTAKTIGRGGKAKRRCKWCTRSQTRLKPEGTAMSDLAGVLLSSASAN